MAAKRNEGNRKEFSNFAQAIDPEFQCNSITPGTPFMTELNKALKYYVCKKIQDKNF